MNRAARRASGLRRSRATRDRAAYLDISPDDLAAHLPGVKDGDLITVTGMTRDHKAGTIRVQPGAQNFIVKVRQ